MTTKSIKRDLRHKKAKKYRFLRVRSTVISLIVAP